MLAVARPIHDYLRDLTEQEADHYAPPPVDGDTALAQVVLAAHHHMRDTEPWRVYAGCVGEQWEPTDRDPAGRAEAKRQAAVCADCRVRRPCLASALAEQYPHTATPPIRAGINGSVQLAAARAVRAGLGSAREVADALLDGTLVPADFG